MDYKKIYDALCERGSLRCKTINHRVAKKQITFPVERHRILPGCMGGKYKIENVSWLTPREHIFAHALLFKVHPTNDKIAWAFIAMCNMQLGERISYNSKKYDFLKKKLLPLRRKQGRKQMLENWEHEDWQIMMKQATRQGQIRNNQIPGVLEWKVKNMMRGTKEMFNDPARKANWRKAWTEATTNNQEYSKKISRATKNSRWINNGKENKRWFGEEPPKGFSFGRAEKGSGKLGRPRLGQRKEI